MNDSIFQHKNGTGKEISAWSIFSLILKKFHWLLLSGAAIALAVFLPFLFLLHRHINQPQLSMYITVQTGYQPREKSIITTFRLPRALLLHIQKYSRVMRFSIRFCRIWTTRTSYQEKSFPKWSMFPLFPTLSFLSFRSQVPILNFHERLLNLSSQLLRRRLSESQNPAEWRLLTGLRLRPKNPHRGLFSIQRSVL